MKKKNIPWSRKLVDSSDHYQLSLDGVFEHMEEEDLRRKREEVYSEDGSVVSLKELGIDVDVVDITDEVDPSY